MRARSRLFLLGAAVMRPQLLHACTVCNTDTGQAVRAGIFDGHFVANVLQLAAPFPIFLAIAALIYKGLPLGELPPAAGSGDLR